MNIPSLRRLGVLLLSLSIIALCLVTQAAAQAASLAAPPVAPLHNVVDTYFGVSVTDPYRYMEDLSSPEVSKWIKAEADYTNAVLSRIPGRAEMVRKVKEYDESEPERVGDLQVVVGGYFFYQKRKASEDVMRLYMRKGRNGAEVLLVDPNAGVAKGAPHMVISFFTPSQDGRYVSYGISPGGSEDAVLHVLDTTTMKETGDLIDRTQFGSPSFLADGKSFVYNRLQKTGPNSAPTDRYLNSLAYLHRLGTSPDEDKPVFGSGVAGITSTPSDIPFVATNPGSSYALGVVAHGVLREVTLYATPEKDLAKPGLQWKKICDVQDDIVAFAMRGDDLYLLSHHGGAQRFKVLRTSLSSPNVAAAETVLPVSENVLQNLNTSADALYVQELHDGIGRLLRIPYGGGKAEEVKLPFAGSVSLFPSDPREPGAYFGTTGWIHGFRVLTYDPAARAVADTGLKKPGKYENPEGLESVEVKAPSYDGTLIPLSIVYRKGTRLDGSSPLLLEGYGAYSITYDPYFSPALLAWYEQGGAFAVAHVRGGGEYGEDWHLAGKGLTKPNTWNDMIACAQYLIEHGYTSARHLAIAGGSAGGITIGRSITERPDLFAVAIDQVPMSDAVRVELSPNGPPNIPEFGTVKEADGFKGLYEMSALHHVKDGVAYPAVMLTSGINDPRVITWQPAKLTARLQAATSSGKPVLFRVDYDAGHGIGSTKTQRQLETADVYSFILWQVGAPGFQPPR